MTDDADARTQLSEMTEITERALRGSSYRDSDLDALYRACPTAFWLAPDGDPALSAVDGPILCREDIGAAEETEEPSVTGRASGVLFAILAAGPLFAATGLMLTEFEPNEGWWNPLARAAVSLLALPLTVMVGLVLALLPVLVGVLALGRFGERHIAARLPATWTLTGGAMGAAIAALFGAGGPIGLALIATSAACARIARTAVRWADPAPA